MRIGYKKLGDYFEKEWMCYCVDLPGSPPIGRGKTKKIAFYHLCTNLLFNKCYDRLDLSEVEIVKE